MASLDVDSSVLSVLNGFFKIKFPKNGWVIEGL